MSRTNKTLDGPVHPCKLWLQWSSDGSIWKAWNKEKKENEYFATEPLRFIVLDVLSTLSGFNQKANKGYYSNELRSLKDKFRLMCDGHLMAEDTWQNIKASFSDVKFTASVYVMVKGGDIADYTLANLKLSGASLGSWIEFVRQSGGTRALYENIVVGVDRVDSGKTGKVEYTFPVFAIKGKTLSDEASAKADELDISLQGYLDAYFNRDGIAAAVDEHHAEPEEEFPIGTDLDSLPF